MRSVRWYAVVLFQAYQGAQNAAWIGHRQVILEVVTQILVETVLADPV